MRIATVLITYNRDVHTARVLEALSRNTVLPDKLFIIQDGIGPNEEAGHWKRVNEMIREVRFCDCEVLVSGQHRGLRRTVVGGIDYAIQKYDAVIVLEDDCVTHPLFMDYMYQGLTKFAGHKSVYSINGYTYDIDVAGNGCDAYFSGRASSWGWGTWRDRWEEYEEDYGILARINRNGRLRRRLYFWGEDLAGYLHGNIQGKCDSWFTFWGLKIIEKNGYCLSPYRSLVENTGFDGSGTHSVKRIANERLREAEDVTELMLPDKIEIPEGSAEGFSSYFARASEETKMSAYISVLIEWMDVVKRGKSVSGYLKMNGIVNVSVWGLGRVGEMLLEELVQNGITVHSVILNKRKQLQEKGIPVVSQGNIPEQTEAVIVVPVYDFERIYNVIKHKEKYLIIGLDELLRNCLSDVSLR